MTEAQSAEQFHAERRTGLGGSDMGAILGVNPYRTPFQVWQEKTGRVEPFAGNLQTRFGTYAEQFVADEYCRRTGAVVRRHGATLHHKTAPILGHVDRLVVPAGRKVAATRAGIVAKKGLECKTAHALAASRSDEWGEDGTDNMPASYLIQCAVYMTLTGCPEWDLAVLFGNSDFRIYRIRRDLELEDMLVEEANRWWRDHVIADMPPDPSSEAEARQRWSRHTDGVTVALDAGLTQDLREYHRIKNEIRDLEKITADLRDRIIPAIGDAETVTDAAGNKLATYRANKDGSKTDWKGVAVALGADADLIAEHTTTTPGARVLRIAKEI